MKNEFAYNQLNRSGSLSIMRDAKRLPRTWYKQIYLLLGWQALVGTLCVCLFFVVDKQEGLSSLLAVVAVTIPNVCFGLLLKGEREPRKDVIRAFIRVVFLLINLGLAFAFFDIQPLGFFASMALVQLSFLLGCRGKVNF